MSMITAQCDKLRETAVELRAHSTFVGFGGVVNRDPMLFDAAQQMEDAADTIEELRNRLTDTKEVETCRNVSDVDGIFVCSECKCQIEGMTVLNGARRWVEPPYCPNCGRKVVEWTAMASS